MFVPEAQASAGAGMGVITVDLADDGPRDAAVVAFEAQRDAEAAAWGWAAAHEAAEGRPQCAPVVSSRLSCVRIKRSKAYNGGTDLLVCSCTSAAYACYMQASICVVVVVSRGGRAAFCTYHLAEPSSALSGHAQAKPLHAQSRRLTCFTMHGVIHITELVRVQNVSLLTPWHVGGRVQPFAPGELKQAAVGKGVRVVVFRAGQLPLRPGLSADQLAAMFVMYGRGK